MSTSIANSPTTAPAFWGRAGTDHPDRAPEPMPSWLWALVESLAYAGAAFDPAASLAALRLAAIRDEELGHGRR